MKKIYSTPTIRVYQVKIHQHLCIASGASGTVNKSSINFEEDEDL